MIHEKSLVIYKNHPALVTGVEGDRINIAVFKGSGIQAENARVRQKDVELLHPGPCGIKDLEEDLPPGNVREAWELLLETNNPSSSPKELAELVYGIYSPCTAWAVYELLRENLYFSGDVASIKPRKREEVEEDEKKREEKQKESGERAAFLEKLKKLPPFRAGSSSTTPVGTPSGSPGGATDNASAAVAGGSPNGLTPTERRFLLDVEALARGRSEKSKTLKELGRTESPEEAHRLLLASGA